jgi:hypothetical protein
MYVEEVTWRAECRSNACCYTSGDEIPAVLGRAEFFKDERVFA